MFYELCVRSANDRGMSVAEGIIYNRKRGFVGLEVPACEGCDRNCPASNVCM